MITIFAFMRASSRLSSVCYKIFYEFTDKYDLNSSLKLTVWAETLAGVLICERSAAIPAVYQEIGCYEFNIEIIMMKVIPELCRIRLTGRSMDWKTKKDKDS